jgi:GntR family transcriptional regulator
MINKNSPIPIYYQLEEHIKGLIEEGVLKPGDVLPPEREYAEKYQISRMTVRQAFTQLVNEGYLFRLQGKGTFVAERKIEKTLQGIISFTEDMRARGLKPASELVNFEVVPAASQIAEQLNIAEDDPVYEIMRIRLADSVPMALETNYISVNLIQGLTEQIVSQSIYAYVEGPLNLRIDSASQVIEASIAGKKEADYLNIPKGAPVMLIERNAYLQDGRTLEFVKSVYRADRYKFKIQMKR